VSPKGRLQPLEGAELRLGRKAAWSPAESACAAAEGLGKGGGAGI